VVFRCCVNFLGSLFFFLPFLNIVIRSLCCIKSTLSNVVEEIIANDSYVI